MLNYRWLLFPKIYRYPKSIIMQFSCTRSSTDIRRSWRDIGLGYRANRWVKWRVNLAPTCVKGPDIPCVIPMPFCFHFVQQTSIFSPWNVFGAIRCWHGPIVCRAWLESCQWDRGPGPLISCLRQINGWICFARFGGFLFSISFLKKIGILLGNGNFEEIQ